MADAYLAELTDYARRVPAGGLKGLLTAGTIQLVLGCIAIYVAIQGFLNHRPLSIEAICTVIAVPVTLAAGATGLVGGRGRSNTQCFIISCLVLSILAACLSIAIVPAVSVQIARRLSYRFVTLPEVLFIVLFSLELVVAIALLAFATRSACCLSATDVLPPDDDVQAMEELGVDSTTGQSDDRGAKIQ